MGRVCRFNTCNKVRKEELLRTQMNTRINSVQAGEAQCETYLSGRDLHTVIVVREIFPCENV